MLLCAMLCATAASAQTDVHRLLNDVANGFRTMANYEVRFKVETEGQHVEGGYAVENEAYYLAMGYAEVYSEGKIRYEVNNERREVVINSVDPASRNILDNPVHAFEFLEEEYTARILWAKDGRTGVELEKRTDEPDLRQKVTVVVNTKTRRPETLLYDYDGDSVLVTILGVAPLKEPLKKYDKKAYKAYETIDFR